MKEGRIEKEEEILSSLLPPCRTWECTLQGERMLYAPMGNIFYVHRKQIILTHLSLYTGFD